MAVNVVEAHVPQKVHASITQRSGSVKETPRLLARRPFRRSGVLGRDGGADVDEVDCVVALAAVSSGRYRDVRDRELWPMGTGWLFAADPTGRGPCLVLP